MYVRWKTSKSKMTFGLWDGKPGSRSTPTPNPTHAAFLVENRRVDGKPRQKILAYLGGIKQMEVVRPDRKVYRKMFLDGIKDRLSWPDLNLTDAQKQVILDQVYKVVPPLTDEEATIVEAEQVQARVLMGALLGR